MTQINTRYLKFKDKLEIPEDLDRDKNLILAGEFEIDDYNEKPQQEGSVDLTYTVRPIRIISQKPGGERVYFKTNQKRHIKQYRAIHHYWQEQQGRPFDEAYEFDNFYDSMEAFINSHIPEIAELWKETKQ